MKGLNKNQIQRLIALLSLAIEHEQRQITIFEMQGKKNPYVEDKKVLLEKLKQLEKEKCGNSKHT